MRIGKHIISPLAFGRRAKVEPQGPVFSPVASEERSALLSSPPKEAEFLPVTSENAFATGSDPTQQLLMALSRFQRHVARAQAGASQDVWSDECMNQLIAAYEIARREGWDDVVEALTETARVLQTYEDAGHALLCLPFLADSYEILCLMVGDLIVGSVRSGVKEKWRARYELVLEDVAAAGLTLVHDEDAPPEAVSSSASESYAESEDSPFELSPLTPFDSIQDRTTPALDDELPRLDDLPPLATKTAPDSAPPLWWARPPARQAEERSADNSVTELEDEAETDDGPGDGQPMASMLFDAPLEEDADEEGERDGAVADAVSAGLEKERNGTSPQVVEVLDKLCECLPRLENYPDGESREVGLPLQHSLDFLRRHARDYGRPGAEKLCHAMEKMCAMALEKRGPLDDRFFELAYAFCGAYVDANSGPHDPIVTNWSGECESLMEVWRAVKTEEVPVDASPEELKDCPPEVLLETAQRAVERGHPADAKLLALQAALQIARAEADEAEARVRAAEARLHEGARAIEEEHAGVRGAEQAVALAQAEVSSRETELANRRTGVAEVERSLAASGQRIEDLEAQVRALQEQLADEVHRKDAILTDLAEARGQEAETRTRLEQALAEEDAARVRLEDTRQHVKHLQQKRAEIEAAIEKTRDVLARQRTSLADIEQTVSQLRSSAQANSADQDLLF